MGDPKASESLQKWKSTFHIVIVGCGIGGLTAAIGIKRAGYKVTVLEQAPELREIGAGIQVSANATRVLQQFGLLETAARHSIEPQTLTWRSYRTGNVLGRQSLSPLTEKLYGLPHFSIHRWDYQAILHNEAKRLGVQIELGRTVSGFDIPQGLVSFSSGDTCKANLIIGADGGRSVCRDTLIGYKTAPIRSGEIAMRLTTNAEAIRRNKDTADLLDSDNLDLWVGPQAHIVSYLLVKNDQFNMVLTQPDISNNDEDLDISLQKVDIERVREIFEGWDPRLKAILEMATQASQSTLGQIEDLGTWVDESSRLVLLGDSAHPMLPYLSQGAAMAVEDAAVLGTLLDECHSPLDVPDLLQVYDRIRRPRAIKMKDLSHEMRTKLGYRDGPEQEERDRQIAKGFSEDHPYPYSTPKYQDWMWGYDAVEAAKKAWAGLLRSRSQVETVDSRLGIVAKL